MNCSFRQKNIIRGKGYSKTSYRCLNANCDAYKTVVDDTICKDCILNVKPTDCPECGKQVEEQMKKYPDGFVVEGSQKVITLTKKALNYSTALKKWVAAGRPTREKKEVTRIHSICTKCDWYDKGNCKGCGCKVSQSNVAVMNKIKMATEHCPKELW